ncbi:hypothetical protein BO94DRAFT_481421 [Aspergillus sclerotioniger CBS 115572]|uniref:Uncharacterized protein n=1 Tax=Aspergillus sclerotioniger CBS 115572 TaxID=1450535 RepID=A0A317XDC8_9EURO|nr:hypothetical protein BO94DRAFT_481421 [Aspergillus sclerotioniger CBS 115572]PWY96539.1 hypothetical protein BO94DRAFT_481421 [Aspergillus sclerotioniger CBS 115572]
MSDAARPGEDTFSQVLQESFTIWFSYLNDGNGDHLLPRHIIDLKSLVCQTPAFLGDGLVPSNDPIAFVCKRWPSSQGKGSLLIQGQSTWKTSKGICELPPRTIPDQLQLGIDSPSGVRLSDDSPFSDWLGVQGLSGYDNGNYLSVLYLAWAYIFSSRWVELLGRSVDHECQMHYTSQGTAGSPQSAKQPKVQVELDDDVGEEETFWWRSVLCSDGGWSATTKHNNHVYLSPWSVSAEDAGMSLATKGDLNINMSDPPRSKTALKYLSRFCMYHGLYAQCSAALAGALYIPFLRGRSVSLPFPRQISSQKGVGDSTFSISDLLSEHYGLLLKYMTLSFNVWGLRSLLCSTFFNPDIECNLISAWLNPAFAIIDSVSPTKGLLATFLATRQPRLGALWLGAILTDVAKSVLRDIRTGMTALDLAASAWTGTRQTFLTSKMGSSQGEVISRDDECRLLYITACEFHERPPIWGWKPFGFTQLSDTDLPVREHAQCIGHCLEYESWEWILTNGHSIRDTIHKNIQPAKHASYPSARSKPATLDDYDYDFFSELLSEGATCGIFGWLRPTGYPHNERVIYQHSWLDLGSIDEKVEPDDEDSDVERQRESKDIQIESWLDRIE